MAISRSQLVKELEPGLNALFGLEYKRYEMEHEEIFDKETSERAFEEEVMLSGFGNAAIKAEGSGVSYDQAQETLVSLSYYCVFQAMLWKNDDKENGLVFLEKELS